VVEARGEPLQTLASGLSGVEELPRVVVHGAACTRLEQVKRMGFGNLEELEQPISLVVVSINIERVLSKFKKLSGIAGCVIRLGTKV
jgi:hypothetical protein